ncbi:MAG: hypothetical protein OXL97_10950 [Chloroflexota bacterium]|nr:hypothetical protein [Chloroflexota bacterium]MDE2884982.1 hypothetical protein [Chloroflexota bacterium]
MRSTFTLAAALCIALAAISCGGELPAPAATPTPMPPSTWIPTSTPVATPTPAPTSTPGPTATATSTAGEPLSYMVSTCAALRELPEVWEEDALERVQAILQAMPPPPDEMQEYHATLTEFLTFVARTGDGTDLYAEAEALNRMEAHFIAAQQLPLSLGAVIAQDCPPDYAEAVEEWIPTEGPQSLGPGQTDRLTREEYLDSCADFMGLNLEFDEEPSWDVLEAILTNLVEEASLVAPPAELVEYHESVVAWMVLMLEGALAGRQEEQTPDDPAARGRLAAVYLEFANLDLALTRTLGLMDPSLKEALAERGCLLQ